MYGTIVAVLKNNTKLAYRSHHVLLPSQTLSLYNKVTRLPCVPVKIPSFHTICLLVPTHTEALMCARFMFEQ